MKRLLVFRHVPHEGLGTIETYLRPLSIEIQYCDLFLGHLPPLRPEHIDFVIAMGGPMNADETVRYPFIGAERRFLRQAIDSGIPTLGVCLGSQLIARALGARVYPGRAKEIGWYRIDLTEDGREDHAFSRFQNKQPTVFQWHGDTFDLPKGAACLASSARFQNQAFKFQSHVYALQFHIEVTGEMIRDWIGKNEAEAKSAADSISPSDVLRGIEQHEPSLRRSARNIYRALFSPLMKTTKSRS